MAAVIVRLIETATNSTEREIDPRLLKAIKSTARSSEDEVCSAVHVLMEKMRKEHSQVYKDLSFTALVYFSMNNYYFAYYSLLW